MKGVGNMANLVHCRICKLPIDKDKDPEGKTWIMPSKNFYYHRNCYEDWKLSNPAKDSDWKDFIYDYLARELKVSYNYHMCEAQREKYLKQDMTNKGIFFSLKYFYEVKNGDWEKSHGGLGIIPYIYNDSCEYWVKKNNSDKGICTRIELQMREAKNQERKVVKRTHKKENKIRFNLSDISEMENE